MYTDENVKNEANVLIGTVIEVTEVTQAEICRNEQNMWEGKIHVEIAMNGGLSKSGEKLRGEDFIDEHGEAPFQVWNKVEVGDKIVLLEQMKDGETYQIECYKLASVSSHGTKVFP